VLALALSGHGLDAACGLLLLLLLSASDLSIWSDCCDSAETQSAKTLLDFGSKTCLI
jgi:hypothetical protein